MYTVIALSTLMQLRMYMHISKVKTSDALIISRLISPHTAVHVIPLLSPTFHPPICLSMVSAMNRWHDPRYSRPSPIMAAVCMRMEFSMSTEPSGSRGGKNMVRILAIDRFMLPHLGSKGGKEKAVCIQGALLKGTIPSPTWICHRIVNKDYLI